tara:strand:+ start:221 stop:952 length:732 start_codon:yes stop_codon:yes gene_type:complete
MAGWIKLHRSMLDWEWYDDVNVCRLFTHCLLRANHKTKSWRGKTIERGQFWTSLDTLSAETKLSKKQIRVALTKLQSTGEVASQGHATGRMITVVNYDSYQEEGTQGADQGQTKGTQGAANKNVKNDNNEKNDKKKPWVSPAGLNLDAWAEFEQHRKDIKKPLTDTARTKAANQIIHLDPAEQQSTVDKSISSRWAGLFPDKITATKVKDQKAEKREQDANDWANNVQADNHTLGNTFDHGQY